MPPSVPVCEFPPCPRGPAPLRFRGNASPAADAPCPEQAFNATALKWHTCAWLLLPVLVFLAGWMHWYAALPLTLLTAAGLAPRERKEPQTRDSLPAFPCSPALHFSPWRRLPP
ncbi:hypothetical protein M5E88_07640 [Akkermansia muciniphila]|nr:hypothetical protein M5E88_07640 [Akkermansia muciniphila]